MSEVTYLHRTNVHYLPGPHAVNNAAQAAQLVEQNRADMRADIRSCLLMQRRALLEKVEMIDAALAEIDGG